MNIVQEIKKKQEIFFFEITKTREWREKKKLSHGSTSHLGTIYIKKYIDNLSKKISIIKNFFIFLQNIESVLFFFGQI